MHNHYETALLLTADVMELVRGDRKQTHGDFLLNHENIARLWTAFLSNRLDVRDKALSAAEVAQMLQIFKIARTQAGAHNDDDYKDSIGYAMIAGGIANARTK